MKLAFHNGAVKAIYTDLFPLRALGQLTVRRASTIEFNALFSLWEVCFTGSKKVVFRHASRAECVKWEIEALTNKL